MIFNQVDIPCNTSRSGTVEADLIVCGPTGVFVVEVKHNSGEVGGIEGASKWPVTHTAHSGKTFNREMRNPVKQVKRQVYCLKQYLKVSTTV